MNKLRSRLQYEKAKETFAKARLLAPNDEEIKKGEFELYYNLGISGLSEEEKLVAEINASRADKNKFDALMAKRKEMFIKIIPDFEKAYSIDPSNESTKSILKMAYVATGQEDKVKTLK
jgi:tetratricopeptide (TPR) repeat protein